MDKTAIILLAAAAVAALYFFIVEVPKSRRLRRKYAEEAEKEEIERRRLLAEMEAADRGTVRFPIAGINYRAGISRYEGIIDVRLVEDPRNEFDELAIKIIAEDGSLLGYVPRGMTRLVREKFGLPVYATAEIEQDGDGGQHYVGEVAILPQ